MCDGSSHPCPRIHKKNHVNSPVFVLSPGYSWYSSLSTKTKINTYNSYLEWACLPDVASIRLCFKPCAIQDTELFVSEAQWSIYYQQGTDQYIIDREPKWP